MESDRRSTSHGSTTIDLPLQFLFSPKVAHFLSAYSHRSFRLAAIAVGISQPALTKSVKSLENQMGVEFFSRSSRGVVPTAAADILFNHLEKVGDLTRSIEIEIAAFSGTGEGLIRLGAGQMWSQLFIPEIVTDFQKLFPLISLEITTDPMPQLIARLKEGQLDIVVGDFDGVDVSVDYRTQRAWSTEFWAFASDTHELARKPELDLAELMQFQWSGYLDGEIFARNISELCTRNNLDRPKVSVKASLLPTLLRITKSSGNIVVLPKELEELANSYGLLPLGLKQPALWTVNTGSVMEVSKETLGPYQVLRTLMKRKSGQSC